jgi:trehalose-6-phosphate synthase
MTRIREVLIVSNRLPVVIKQKAGKVSVERAIGGVATTLNAVAERYRARWVGWTGLPRVLSGSELADAGLPDTLTPVQARYSLIRRYYDRFANRLLWPSLHGMTPSFAPDVKDWAAFCEVNRRFARTIKQTVRSADELIWVHDYHLTLLPHYLRELGLTNRIGFFLHTPFPFPAFLTDMLYARRLFSSLTAADVIGFQTERDATNFRQFMKLMHRRLRRGQIGVFPIGTNAEAHQAAAERPGVRRSVRDIHGQTKGRRLIFSLSRLDYTKGIIIQLLAVERFLTEYPRREEVRYKLVVAPSREQLGEYRRLKERIERVVRGINMRLGNSTWTPVDYSYQNLDFEGVVAWYKAADVLLLLPEMDGMNLIAKEYVAARFKDPGVLVLSTAMGAAYQLSGALLVEAKDARGAAAALHQAQEMPPAERADRWRTLSAVVQNQDVFWWAEQFLAALSAAQVIRKL